MNSKSTLKRKKIKTPCTIADIERCILGVCEHGGWDTGKILINEKNELVIEYEPHENPQNRI